MKRRASSKGKRNRWADHLTHKAKAEHYPARSVYKLKEIQQKTGLIRKGHKILDLGCAPGSWLLYAGELTGPGGSVTGVDLQAVDIALPPRVRAHVGDIFELEELLPLVGTGYDLVMSDMAPNTTGHPETDAARSYNLCEAALGVAESVLKPGGAFLCKIFQGSDFELFVKTVKARFARHKIFKPQSTRKASREIYVMGLELKKTAHKTDHPVQTDDPEDQ